MDVLIIGAGPSGCVAASYLHNNNITVKVVEKNKFPRFVIGESLLPRCMDHFEEVGLLDVLKDFGFEIKEGARFLKDGIVCEFDFSKKHTPGCLEQVSCVFCRCSSNLGPKRTPK